MADFPLKTSLTEAMKAAMRAQDKARLSAIRMIIADIKRIEIDERIDVDDARALIVLDKIAKQRRDSINQFRNAERHDLADKEAFELSVVEEFLPQPLSADEIATLIDDAIATSGAQSAADMGKVMALLKPAMQGRADMSIISKQVKTRLG
ncbi:MAG TPA: GatB/YqeY domain-containing protein [Spongiibacteraceae bacterium]|nr:GatB/YqeY domain-containing protein [Spongiibacteraceae bacterium]